MHLDIERRLRDFRFVTRPQLFDSGFDDWTIAASLRSGEFIRIGPGLYAGRQYNSMTAVDQHILRCHAVAT